MKKLILMAAFVAGPILYAQQKPTPDSSVKKQETLKAEQAKTTQAQSSQIKAFNLSDTEAVNRKSTTKNPQAKTTAIKKVRNAESLNDLVEK